MRFYKTLLKDFMFLKTFCTQLLILLIQLPRWKMSSLRQESVCFNSYKEAYVPVSCRELAFFWARMMLIRAQNQHETPAVPRSHYKVRQDFEGVNVLCRMRGEHFAVNIFFRKDFSSVKHRVECSAFPSDSPRVTPMDLLHPPMAAESSREQKIVVPCLSACLFDSNPAAPASSKAVLRLWGCFCNAIGTSKWHLHFIILCTVGENPKESSPTKRLGCWAQPSGAFPKHGLRSGWLICAGWWLILRSTCQNNC